MWVRHAAENKIKPLAHAILPYKASKTSNHPLCNVWTRALLQAGVWCGPFPHPSFHLQVHKRPCTAAGSTGCDITHTQLTTCAQMRMPWMDCADSRGLAAMDRRQRQPAQHAIQNGCAWPNQHATKQPPNCVWQDRKCTRRGRNCSGPGVGALPKRMHT